MGSAVLCVVPFGLIKTYYTTGIGLLCDPRPLLFIEPDFLFLFLNAVRWPRVRLNSTVRAVLYYTLYSSTLYYTAFLFPVPGPGTRVAGAGT